MPSDCGTLELAPEFDPDAVTVESCGFSWSGPLLLDTPITFEATVTNPNQQDAAAGVTWSLTRPNLGALAAIVAQASPVSVLAGETREFSVTTALNDPVADDDGVISTIRDHDGWFIRARTVNVAQQSFAAAATEASDCGCGHGAETSVPSLVPGR